MLKIKIIKNLSEVNRFSGKVFECPNFLFEKEFISFPS